MAPRALLVSSIVTSLLATGCVAHGRHRSAAQAGDTLLMGTGAALMLAGGVGLASEDREDFAPERPVELGALVVGGLLLLGGTYGLVRTVQGVDEPPTRRPGSRSSPGR